MTEFEMVQFLYPWAKRAFDLEINKYPDPLFRFLAIDQYIQEKSGEGKDRDKGDENP